MTLAVRALLCIYAKINPSFNKYINKSIDKSVLLTEGYLLGGPEEEVEDDGEEAGVQAVHGG